jgi:hypothetical protein
LVYDHALDFFEILDIQLEHILSSFRYSRYIKHFVGNSNHVGNFNKVEKLLRERLDMLPGVRMLQRLGVNEYGLLGDLLSLETGGQET